MEEWRRIYGFPDYEVSNLGNVRRVTQYPSQPNRKPGMVRPTLSVRGYYRVKIAAPDGAFKHRFVHNLMAQEFLPNPSRHTSVRHNNGLKTDNRLENLRWGYRDSADLEEKTIWNGNSGEGNGCSKLTVEQVFEIRKLSKRGATYESLGGIYGVSGSQIGRICRGEKWKSLRAVPAKKYS